MTRGEQRLSITGPSGALELALNLPEQAPRGIALVAHPHPLQGGTMDNKVVQTRVAQQLTPERMVLIAPAVARFATSPVPADTIVVHGEEDDVVALADVFAWARPQQLPIVVFPGCGHFFHGRLPQLTRVIAGMW